MRLGATKRPRPLPLVEVSGADARERGRAHGEAARDLVAASIEFYRGEFSRKSGLGWDDVIANVGRWNDAIEAFLPGIVEEVAGVAEGANQRLEDVLALNARGELRSGDPFALAPECTAFALANGVAGDGHVWCGQNWDWRSEIAGTQLMIRVEQPGKPTFVSLIEAGTVARHGASSAGLALNANGLAKPFANGLGLPQTYIRRKVLESWTMGDALEAVMSSTQILSTNMLITHRDGISIDLETTPARHGYEVVAGVYGHANAFEGFVPEQVRETYRPSSSDSLYRGRRVADLLRAAPAARTSEEVHALVVEALSDHLGYPNSVCNHPDDRAERRYQTHASLIVDLTTGEFWVAGGNPCSTAFELLPWNLYETAPVAEGVAS
jgi:isopenicillin-N N-acyltransferase-like protein